MSDAGAEVETKVCTKCKVEKPKNAFSKYASRRDGLQPWCKECASSAAKKRALANKLKNANGIDVAGTKVCTTCQKNKPKTEFNKHASMRDGLQSQCKECAKFSQKKSVLANKLKNTNGIDTSGVKVCPRCHKEKEKTKFGVSLSCRDGSCSYCKECVSRDSRARYERIRRVNEEARARGEDIQVIEKYCSACGETKSNDDFSNNVLSPSGLSHYCKKCASQRSKLYYARQQALSGALATKSYSRWSREDDQFLIENRDKMTVYQMAIELGRTRSSISSRVARLRRAGDLV